MGWTTPPKILTKHPPTKSMQCVSIIWIRQVIDFEDEMEAWDAMAETWLESRAITNPTNPVERYGGSRYSQKTTGR